jgi:hypothetical protein
MVSSHGANLRVAGGQSYSESIPIVPSHFSTN